MSRSTESVKKKKGKLEDAPGSAGKPHQDGASKAETKTEDGPQGS